jgi:FKBP-type peptidyl-prolyl cis-trans isomerase (trigger factor)
MSATITKLPGSRVEVAGEIDAGVFDESIKHATQKFVANAEIDGFRRGKAPEKLVVEKIGEDKILHEAAELALQAAWPKILEENKIEAIGPTEFHVLKMARGNALAWKAAVAVVPEITLPDYKKIAAEVNSTKPTGEIEITSKEIDETIEYINKTRNRDKETAAGPIDDTFAQSLGNFPTLEALKDNIRDGIRMEKEAKRHEEHRGKLADEIAKAATVETPEVMIEGEKQKMLRELQASITDMSLEWNKYLEHLKTTEEDMKKGWQQDAEKRVRIGLALHAIARQEKIEPTADEVNERLVRLLTPYSEEERKKIDERGARDYAYSIIGNEKVLAFLESQK